MEEVIDREQSNHESEEEIEEVIWEGLEETKEINNNLNGRQNTIELKSSIREKAKSSKEVTRILSGINLEDTKTKEQQIPQPTATIELDKIVLSFHQALSQTTEDRVKEKENLKQFEKEQRLSELMSPIESKEIKKAHCIKLLGEETFYKIYNYLKQARVKNMPFDVVKEQIDIITHKDKHKMNAIFIIDQIVDLEIYQDK